MRDCTHVFAPCPDDCTSHNYRTIPVIDLDMQAARSERTDLVVLGIWVPIFILGLLIFGVSIWQGPENWRAVIAAEARV